MISDDMTGGGGGGGGPTGDERPSPARLDMVWTAADSLIREHGGTDDEAHAVAVDMVTLVDQQWVVRRLRYLARDGRLWGRFLTRKVFRRWLTHLQEHQGDWDHPSQSQARNQLLAIAQRAAFGHEDYALLEYIVVHEFSVAEVAVMFELDEAELRLRLRMLWAAARGNAES